MQGLDSSYRVNPSNRGISCLVVLPVVTASGPASFARWSSSSSSSSSSRLSDSDDDYYSLNGNIRSFEEESQMSDQSDKLESSIKAYDDSYGTNTASRRSRSLNSKAKKKTLTAIPYQYQVSLYIQMELCQSTTLQDWIHDRNNGECKKRILQSDHKIWIGEASEIFQQLCSGLAHIHNSNVIHRDLKPANIFVSIYGRRVIFKIGDFGLSKQLHNIVNNQQMGGSNSKPPSPHKQPKSGGGSGKDTKVLPKSAAIVVPVRPAIPTLQALGEDDIMNVNLTAGIGTASYAAPEQVQSKNYGTAVDIFSLGLIFLELVSCFETEHERLHNLQECRKQRVPKWIEENYPDIASTILACTRPSAHDRPTANELINPEKDLDVLKGQLIEKDMEITEKNEMIKKLRMEIERMRALVGSKQRSERTPVGNHAE
mmetsp:Transcript_484/g.1060  ORF Transcript_484/g.1060 Transcript_484/m.1060 type:complete len:428 (+) Transcript_484:451-1734(+)